jgi:hypothetical protein
VAAIASEYGIATQVIELGGLTYDEANALRTEMERVFAASGLDSWGIGIRVTTGQVEVTVEKSATAEVERVMRKSVGDFMVTVPDKRTAALPFEDVVLWSVGTNESNDSRDAAPQGGGKWIRMSDNGARCTMGYVVQTASSAKRGLSGGHCAGVGDTDDDVTDLNLDGGNNGQIYGNVLVNSYANNQPDAMSWPIASWDGNARVYMSDSGWKTVVGYLYEANQSGVQVCGTGWGIKANENTDQKCNPVIPSGLQLHGGWGDDA